MSVFLQRLKVWLGANRKGIFVLFSVVLVGILSFQSGVLHGRLAKSAPLVVSIPALPQPERIEAKGPVTGGAEAKEAETDARSLSEQNGAPLPSDACVFVGSRNSDKYHLATCAVVKRIKPENRVCFATSEEAKRRGYVPSCLK